MNALNLPDQYIRLLNWLIGLTIPCFLALSVSDAFRLHYASAVVSAPSEITHAPRSGLVGPRPRQAYDIIVKRDIFNLAPPPEAPTAPVENEHLDVILIGTSQVTSGRPFAIIENNGNQTVYRVGDTIPAAGRLLSVGRDRVIILHDGHRVALKLPSTELKPGPPLTPIPGEMRRIQRMPQPFGRRLGGIHKLGPNRYALDRSTVDSNIQNMAPLFTQIRATPQVQNGVTNGFLLTEIQPHSIFQQIGLQDGDLLQTVNGQPVGDPVKALGLLQSLQGQSQITLNVVRNGTPQQIYYNIQGGPVPAATFDH
jgi:general secretion pathway protein C